jgi:hypothetical protein
MNIYLVVSPALFVDHSHKTSCTFYSVRYGQPNSSSQVLKQLVMFDMYLVHVSADTSSSDWHFLCLSVFQVNASIDPSMKRVL